MVQTRSRNVDAVQPRDAETTSPAKRRKIAAAQTTGAVKQKTKPTKKKAVSQNNSNGLSTRKRSAETQANGARQELEDHVDKSSRSTNGSPSAMASRRDASAKSKAASTQPVTRTKRQVRIKKETQVLDDVKGMLFAPFTIRGVDFAICQRCCDGASSQWISRSFTSWCAKREKLLSS